MQVNALKLQYLIEHDVQYRIPLYQRPYVWNEEEQWQYLLADLVRLAEATIDGRKIPHHFMGPTVHEVVSVLPGTQPTRLVIDGQQRLTTLQLITKACHDLSKSIGSDRYSNAFARMAFNNHALSEEPDDKFKVLPTNADRDAFRDVMSADNPEMMLASMGFKANTVSTGKPIPDAYLYFYRSILDWIMEGEAPDHRLSALHGAISGQLVMVVIELGEDDDAQMIFETMNARGAPLLAADLVKNSLLSELDRQGADLEKLYRTYWQDFDNDDVFWRYQVGRGHARKPRLELLMQHAISLISRQEVVPSELYLSYRRYADSPEAVTATERLKRFQTIGKIYKRLIKGVEDFRLQTFLYRLEAMDTGTAYPFLISILEHHPGEVKLHGRVAELLESFLVRRMICRLDTRGYNRLFLDLIPLSKLDSTELPLKVEARLLENKGDNERWPNDSEFLEAWTNLPIYSKLTRARTRMILEALEEAKRSAKTEERRCPRNLTIEHVLPQTWEEYWPIADGPDQAAAKIRREASLHSIGNLTLLTNRLNAAQQNYPWTDFSNARGQPMPGKRSALNLQSVLFLNRELTEKDQWDDEFVAQRSRDLFETATQIWDFPK